MKWNETIKPRLSIHRRNSTHSCGFSQCYLNAAKRQQQTFVCVWKFHFMSEPSVWFEKNAHKAQGAAWSLTAKWQFAVKFVFQWERWTFVALTCGRFCPFQTKCWDNRLLFSSVREHGWNLQNRIVWGKQNSIGCKKKKKKEKQNCYRWERKTEWREEKQRKKQKETKKTKKEKLNLRRHKESFR